MSPMVIDPNVITPWLPAIVVAVIGATAAGVWAIVNRRGADKNRAKVPAPPTWPEMWARMEAQDERIAAMETRMESRDRAFVNVLNDAAEQWPKGSEGPYFDKADLDVLNDTVPSAWVKRIRRAARA